MIDHESITHTNLIQKLKDKSILLGGNKKLKIYGTLNCASGKRMKKENRVFFWSEIEARNEGYRPCGNCLNKTYKIWLTSNFVGVN
jgi:methylphosphotriester-DNA--protein-cysteine methyltransferase